MRPLTLRCVAALLMLAAPSAGSQAPRLAVAVGHALPTNAKFGLFPIVRAEWYVTPTNRTAGLVVDGYVTRAFASVSREGEFSRSFEGYEVGLAASGTAQALPAGSVSPYVVGGILLRYTSRSDSTWTSSTHGVSRGSGSRVEPNVGLGVRALVGGGQAVRLEVPYLRGMAAFPVTAGITF